MRASAILALAGASMVAAHSTPIAIWVNGKDQGVGNKQDGSGYMRTPPNNSPITDVTSKDMTCNVGGSTAATQFIEVQGGDEIEIEWHHNTRGDDIIDPSHKGPVLTYIAPAESNGEGDVWVKLAESGYENGEWAVINLINNGGKHSVTLPDLAAGEYLLRPEIIALHEGDRLNGAQFYMDCIQLKVTSSGAKTLPAGVAIPGAYSATDAGVKFNLYNGVTSYPIPGPKVWDGASSGTTPTTPKPSATVAPTPVATETAAATSGVPISSPSATVPSTPAPSASAPAGNGNGNNGGNSGALPETFTLETFIAWLKTAAGKATADKLRRAHPRAFAF